MQQQKASNLASDSLLQRDSTLVPAAEYIPSIGPERRYCEFREEFRRDMAALYPSKQLYRYHNLEHHIEPGVIFLKTLAQRCVSQGIALDVDVVDAAWWGHDADFANDPAILGFKSREHMHATIVYRTLRTKGASEEFARRAERAVACTNVFETPVTNEDKAVRAIDMHNVALEYALMRDNTLRLYEEMRNTVNSTLSVPEFVRTSVKYLGLYMLPFLQLTNAAIDSEGRSEWHKKTFGNVLRLWREHCSVAPQILAVLSATAAPSELIDRRGLASGHEGVIIGALEGRAKELHSACSRLVKRWGSEAAVCCAPMVGSAISLPDASVNEVLLAADDFEHFLQEACRILAPEGVLTLVGDFNNQSLQRQVDALPILEQCGFELVNEESDVHGSITHLKRVVIN